MVAAPRSDEGARSTADSAAWHSGAEAEEGEETPAQQVQERHHLSGGRNFSVRESAKQATVMDYIVFVFAQKKGS
jgi:hypothetical protein